MSVMGEVPKGLYLTTKESVVEQIQASWPKKFMEICKDCDSKGLKRFFVYTFCKWDHQEDKAYYNIYHQVRMTPGDPFWGTTLRLVNLNVGAQDIIWTLPIEEVVGNYFTEGNDFESNEMREFIRMKRDGTLDRLCDNFKENYKGLI